MARTFMSLTLVILWGCASLKDVSPGTLETAKCVADVLRSLPETRATEISVVRHYRVSEPVIEYEYYDASGHDRFTWFEIYSDSINKPDHYAYIYPGDRTRDVPLPTAAYSAMEMGCHVRGGQVLEIP